MLNPVSIVVHCLCGIATAVAPHSSRDLTAVAASARRRQARGCRVSGTGPTIPSGGVIPGSDVHALERRAAHLYRAAAGT